MNKDMNDYLENSMKKYTMGDAMELLFRTYGIDENDYKKVTIFHETVDNIYYVLYYVFDDSQFIIENQMKGHILSNVKIYNGYVCLAVIKEHDNIGFRPVISLLENQQKELEMLTKHIHYYDGKIEKINSFEIFIIDMYFIIESDIDKIKSFFIKINDKIKTYFKNRKKKNNFKIYKLFSN